MGKIHCLLISVLLLVYIAQSLSCLPGCSSCVTPYNCQPSSCQQGVSCCSPLCTTCVNQTKCSACINGFLLNAGSNLCYLANSCQQPSCSSCSANACSACSGPTYLDSYTFQCLSCGVNCGQCTSPNYCNTCNVGFIAVQGICQSCIANCMYCTTSSACTNCNSGYYLNAQSQCSACSQNCLSCNQSSSNCTQCAIGYGLLNSNCIKCQTQINNCLQCSQIGQSLSCSTCLPNYYLSSASVCLNCPSYCLTCNSSSCLQCITGFYLNSNTSSCMQCPQYGCLSCANGTSCTQCVMGSYFNAQNNTCVQCAPTCSVCLGANFCLGCFMGYFLKGGLCYPCANQCTQCVDNYQNCLQCQSGFYQPNGRGFCRPCPQYCLTCTSPQNCSLCSQGLYFLNGSCVPCSATNCLNCEMLGTNICAICQNYYYLSNSTCLPCIQNCQSCSNQISCNTCNEAYYLNANNTCTLCTEHCQFCHLKKGVATCSSCTNPYYQVNGVCVRCAFQCQECVASQFQCTTCLPGYYLISNSGNATQVNCGPCQPPCLTCSQSPSQCTSCRAGYELTAMFTCTACLPGCLVCDQVVDCLMCYPGYAKAVNYIENLQSYSCVLCPQNCYNCTATSSNTTICSTCFPGYTKLQNLTCFPCGITPSTIGCQTCNQQAQCVGCLPGLELNSSNACVAPQLQSNDNSKMTAFYIALVVILALICLGLIGLIVYDWHMKKQSQKLGMYTELP